MCRPILEEAESLLERGTLPAGDDFQGERNRAPDRKIIVIAGSADRPGVKNGVISRIDGGGGSADVRVRDGGLEETGEHGARKFFPLSVGIFGAMKDVDLVEVACVRLISGVWQIRCDEEP